MEAQQQLTAKSDAFVKKVVSDTRWNLQDELMCQVLGFTLHGYLFGIGRVHCLMDVDDIHSVAINQLAGIGIGRNYVTGMIQFAYQEFTKENNTSWQNQLNGVGHSHALNGNLDALVESIFGNTERIKQARQSQKKPFWKFWR